MNNKILLHQDKNPDAPSMSKSIEEKTNDAASQTILSDASPGVTQVLKNIDKSSVILGSDQNTYISNPYVKNTHYINVNSRHFINFIRAIGKELGIHLKKYDINEIIEALQSHAEFEGRFQDVYYRVAPTPDGIEIDIGDSKHSRIAINKNKVEIIEQSSEVPFYRTPTMKPLVIPAENGNHELLKKYINIDEASYILLLAWISYTLAQPKVPKSKYVILVLHGNQGSGKTVLCKNIIQSLIDPRIVGVQSFPNNQKDLVIDANNAHVLFYDNIRSIKPYLSDILCISSTGGSLTQRKLYTESDQHVQQIHVAMVLNGIHSFIDQPDLAQRCLQLNLKTIDEVDRKPESEFISEFETDLPIIFRGILDLISSVFMQLPDVEVTNPERMIEFVHWLAAMEKVDRVPTGVYQTEYSASLNDTMLDSLLDYPLAEAIINLVSRYPEGWSSTPAELLDKLNSFTDKNIRYHRDWPPNSISLSKRLMPLAAGLERQGITISFSRGKHRNITITTTREMENE